MVLTVEVWMIYVHLGVFLWLLLTPFIHVKEKMKNLKEVSAKMNEVVMWKGKGLFLNIAIEEQQN